jgi:hypothetical protein
MNASFGIDHPLLATNDIEGLRNRLIALGFNMTAIGKHPWGTSTSLAMFDGCLLEIMGIYDSALVDALPAGDFRFGRHVYEHLQRREGVALTALHSTNTETDALTAQHAGFRVAGHLEFSRDVTLPNGSTDQTKTTLALLPNDTFPRLSFFLCQQHRPELIYVPEWLQHPNTVNGILGITIVAEDDHHETLTQRFCALYGDSVKVEGGTQFQTANGYVRLMNANAYENAVGPIPNVILQERAPAIVSMDFNTRDLDTLLEFISKAGFEYAETKNGIVLISPEQTANTTLCFRTV